MVSGPGKLTIGAKRGAETSHQPRNAAAPDVADPPVQKSEEEGHKGTERLLQKTIALRYQFQVQIRAISAPEFEKVEPHSSLTRASASSIAQVAWTLRLGSRHNCCGYRDQSATSSGFATEKTTAFEKRLVCPIK